MAGTRRHRRPVPGDSTAETGLAAGHAEPVRRAQRRSDLRAQGFRSRLGDASTAPPGRRAALDAYRVARDKWVETVLRDVAGWAESLSWGQVPGVQAQSPNRVVTVTAQAALAGPDGIGALGASWSTRSSRCAQTPNDLWAATPIDRMEALLRENNIRDRHRHRRPLVGTGVRPAGQHGGVRHRRCADLDRGAAHPGRVPDRHRPPVHHRRRPRRAAAGAVRGVRRRRRGDHRSPRRSGASRGRTADPVVLRIRRGRQAARPARPAARPTPIRPTRPRSRS